MKHSIEVDVKAHYIDEQSRPQENKYVYAYTIRISNRGLQAVQLLSRKWRILDGNNNEQIVQGLGVVGEQPRILPGESYSYTSGLVMATTSGTMNGAYTMKYDAGTEFAVQIPTFALVRPQALH
ncbi:MAG: ApaG protein [Lentisphaeria bacterium]|jgi:ApaG protein